MQSDKELQEAVVDLVKRADADGIDQLAVGAVILHEGAMLLVTRADDEDVFPKHAEIPGGSVDPGEDLLTAVARETMEETGLQTRRITEYLDSFDFTLSDGRVVRQFNFLLEPKTTDVKLNPKEHSAFHWWDTKDAAYLDTILISEVMKGCVADIAEKLLVGRP